MTLEVSVLDLSGKSQTKIQLPAIFDFPVRVDLIRRAVVALQSHRFLPHSRDPMAGKRTTAASFGVGRDLARVPRVKGEGHPRAGNAAFAPMTVKGRLAFPPAPTRILRKKINRKEHRLALLSALGATRLKPLVERRGHRIPAMAELPLIVSDELQKLSKTEEARTTLGSLGLWEDVEKVTGRTKIRGGRGANRGRPKKHPVGPLFVIERDEGIRKAVGNLLGVDVVEARNLTVEHLAPGTHAGRLVVFTESAIKILQQRLGRAAS